MNRFLRLIIIGAFGALAIHQAICYAATTTVNGVIVTTHEITDAKYKSVVIMDTHDNAAGNGTTTYEYNDSIGSDTAAGAVNVVEYNDDMGVQIRIDTLGSTGLDIRVEGRFGTPTQWAEIVTKSFSAVTTIDYVINVAETPRFIRVGGKPSGTKGTDSYTITGLYKGWLRR